MTFNDYLLYKRTERWD